MMTTREQQPDTAELWNALAEQQRRLDEQATEMQELRAANERMHQELERQRLEKASGASRPGDRDGSRRLGRTRVSRAGLLKAAAAGAAGVVALQGVGHPESAFAGTDGDVALGLTRSATAETKVQADGTSFATNLQGVFRADASTAPSGTNADGVRGVGAGSWSGVAGWGGGSDGRGVSGFGGGTNGAGVVGVSAGVPNPGSAYNCGVAGYGGSQIGVRGVSESYWGVFGDGGSGIGGSFVGQKGALFLQTQTALMPPVLAQGQGVYEDGMIWAGNNGNAHLWLCTVGNDVGTWVPFMHGNSNDGTNETLVSKVSTQQYTLSNSDGVTWVDMDATNLFLSLTPKHNSLAIMSGNSDLWTSQAGYNQDLGISISGGSYPTTAGQPEAWKESGGFAGTFSPNAAYVQTVLPLAMDHAYTVKLQWKTNKNASGATIWAGAGPIGGKFSPTRLTVLLIPTP